jgi:hypothetical protein
MAALEKKYDIRFKAVFEAIRELMTPLEPKKKRPIEFAAWEKLRETPNKSQLCFDTFPVRPECRA